MNGFYWIYLIMMAFLLWYECTVQQESKRLIYYAACGFLILIFSVQDDSVSIDIAEYMTQWAQIAGLPFGEMLSHKFEIGFVLLCRLLEAMFSGPRVLLVVLAVGMLVPFGRSFEKETEDPMIALMAFLALGMYMHAMIFWRQLVAMAILTFSYRFICQRRFWPFLLTVLVAMTFHKTAVVFLPLYFVYRIPVDKWLMAGCAAASVVLAAFGKPIIRLGIRLVYPGYSEYPLLTDGGVTLLALLWVVTCLSYWILRDRMGEPCVRIPFLMILVAATIQPVCFAFFWWLRIVLYFRVALAPITALLYHELFRNPENRAMRWLSARSPRLHGLLAGRYGKRWFAVVTLLTMFLVLFVWYCSELDGAVYVMAPVV